MATLAETFRPSNCNPVTSLVFATKEYRMEKTKVKEHPVDFQGDQITCIGFSQDMPVDFKRVILVRPEFFFTPNGTPTRSFIKNSLLKPYGINQLPRNGLMIGIMWTNVLKSLDEVYHCRLGDIKIWEDQKQAKKSFRRTIQFLEWATTLSTYLQKNVSWKEVQTMCLEYVENATYPLNTLQSNFQQVARKYKRTTE